MLFYFCNISILRLVRVKSAWLPIVQENRKDLHMWNTSLRFVYDLLDMVQFDFVDNSQI